MKKIDTVIAYIVCLFVFTIPITVVEFTGGFGGIIRWYALIVVFMTAIFLAVNFKDDGE